MSSSTTHALFERYHACWEARDPDRIAELHTPDAVFHLHAGQEPARGRDAIRDAAAETFKLVPDLAFTEVSLRVGDDFWVAQWKMSGTSAAGSPVDIDLVDFVVVEDGAVKEKHSYVDGVAMRAALTPPTADTAVPADTAVMADTANTAVTMVAAVPTATADTADTAP
ncbi:nuclear transport factor 2 family protein [Streptomyces sp. G45]|uniref:nuclear transport factor 2 family protein n=1 Tax=Streptomyces sp. G45 TaxID=3406627 RepID=UPI003C188D52